MDTSTFAGQRTRVIAAAFVALLLWCNTSAAQQARDKIIGGRPDPALVQGPVVLVARGSALCSGVLVGSQTVLTAAHCTVDSSRPERYRVFIGGEAYTVTRLVAHPLFEFGGDARTSAPHDVGVIELSSKPTVEPMPVFIDRPVTLGTRLTIAGYGTHESSAGIDKPEELARVARSVVDELSRDGVIFQRHAGGRASSCPGDSGSPAILLESGYQGVVGTLCIGTNQVLGGNCELVAEGRFGHVYLQSPAVRRFLGTFPDVQYISGYRIFIEKAAKSAIAALRKLQRASSIGELSRGIRPVLTSVNKARQHADGSRRELLGQAARSLRACSRSRSLVDAKSRLQAAMLHLQEVRVLGVF